MDVDQYRNRYTAELRSKIAARSTAVPTSAAGSVAPAPSATASLGDRISNIADAGLSLEERSSALREVQAATFLGPVFDQYRAQFRGVLRSVIARSGDALAPAAIELLALDKDDLAREALLKGLQDDQAAIVPPAKALQLLALDDHGVAIPIARDLLAKTADLGIKEEALRVLASDPGSADLLAGVLADTNQPTSLRSISASGLRAVDPKRLVDEASRIVADENEDENLKANVLSAFDSVRGRAALGADLQNTLEKLDSSAKNESLRAVAKRVLRRGSPE